MNAPNTAHDPALLIDPEVGRVLESPPAAINSRRWAESHPFVELQRTDRGFTLLAGPDAARVARGAGGTDYVTYAVERETAGFLHLRRTR